MRLLPLVLAAAVVALASPLSAAPKSVSRSTYDGKVGRLAAKFTLDWHSSGQVNGSYYYPSRGKGQTYVLMGDNSRQGKLYLEEYERIDDALHLTAKCWLSKKIEKGRVVWRGTMKNEDGRSFAMELRKTN